MPAKDTWKWWYYVLAGLASLAAAVYFYIDFSQMEAEGGTRVASSHVAFLYNLFGIWGVVALFAGAGLLLIVVGLISRRDKPSGEDSPAE